jgi:polyribonucleotide nucleotidyltransferase
MSLEAKKLKVKVGHQLLELETGKIARQAHGAVVLRCGETVVFSAVTRADGAADDASFFPLRVDYQEKFSSAGKTLGGYLKREGRPTQRETLISRMIDRPVRPLFPEGYFNEVQIQTTVWSFDGVNAPDVMAINASSAALVISDIPFQKPLGGVRVGLINNEFIVNPTIEEQKSSKLDLVLAGTEDAVLMIEGYCDFLTEDQVMEAIETGHRAIREFCKALAGWRAEIGQPKHLENIPELPKELVSGIMKTAAPFMKKALITVLKQDREAHLGAAKEAVMAEFAPKAGEEKGWSKLDVDRAFKAVSARMMRDKILDEKVRVDGRSLTDIRSIFIEQNLLPRVHGSSLFTRGETQAMAVCTLGGKNMAQKSEDLSGDVADRFYLQYFFPPYSVGEVGRVGAPGRREVGHGKLAERALLPALPTEKEFPYTMRLESNITESNGSSSMASVCGGCLALMDAGVPIKRPVSGIAMGLILEGDRYVILSDILGMEDALGDMDFKITGDKEGITAFQMDIKVEGITPTIMRAALEQARGGRIHILKKMIEACPKPREEMSRFAPRIEMIQVKPSKIGAIIGPGGKQIRAIVEETGVEIDINDDGVVQISSPDAASIEKAKMIINGIISEVEIGRVYLGKVTSVVPFGAFVEVLPGKEGLCHISELDHARIEDITKYPIKQGDQIEVKVQEINERGQLKLSRKATMPKPEGSGQHKTEGREPRGERTERREPRSEPQGAQRELNILPPPDLPQR